MIGRKNILAASIAGITAIGALATPLAASAQAAAPRAIPSYAHAYARDPFPYARPVAVVRVGHHYRWPAHRYPAYAYGYYPYPAYGYPYYGYGYPGWYGPSFSVGIGFRFGGGYARIGGRWR
ncbi:MAG TPA: hypothetical protein VHT05_10085 [Candidatus Elarobacter sp.]|jgi:hypothetical protein|nr:hypothetical protein [Candidatus Elarobacter sp.]